MKQLIGYMCSTTYKLFTDYYWILLDIIGYYTFLGLYDVNIFSVGDQLVYIEFKKGVGVTGNM